MNIRRYLRFLLCVCVLLSVLCSTSLTALASTYENVPIDTFYDGDDFGYEDISLFSNNDVETGKGDYNIRFNFGYGSLNSEEWVRKSFLLSKTISDAEMKGYANVLTFNKRDNDGNSLLQYVFSDQFVIERTDKTKIASKGQNLTFSIKGVQEWIEGYSGVTGNLRRSSYMDTSKIQAMYMYVYSQNGTGNKVLSLTGDDVQKYVTGSGEFINIAGEVNNIPVDTYKVNLFIVYGIVGSFNNNDGDTTLTDTNYDNVGIINKYWGFSEDASVIFRTNDNTSGLLSNIIGFIQSILQGVQNIFSKLGDIASNIVDSFSQLFSKLGGWFTDLFTKLGDWFSDLVTKIGNFMTSVGNWFSTLFGHILDLPEIMWGWIENGLKALFVPDAEFIEYYKERWETLMQDRFGALYQVLDAFSEFYDALSLQSGSSDTIKLPKVSYTFENGATFELGGYNVKIVPDGFGFLVDSIKLIIDIVCSFLVMNAMKNKYERLVGDRL